MQLDIFEHSRDVMLRHSVIDALRDRNAAATARAIGELAAEYADDSLLPAFNLLCERLGLRVTGPLNRASASLRGRGPADGTASWVHQEDAADTESRYQFGREIKACIELALTDAYGEYEQASAWLTCIEEMFGRFDRVKLMDEEVALQGFDLENELTVVAICRKGKQRASVALASLEFPDITSIEARWLKAWKQFSRGLA